jgi:hypothetical protein
MSTGRVSGKSKPRGEAVFEDEDDDEYEPPFCGDKVNRRKKSAKSGGALLFQRHM